MEKSGTATVVKNTGSQYLLSELPEWNLIPAVLRGRIRLKGGVATNPVAVGDRVRYAFAEDPTPEHPATPTPTVSPTPTPPSLQVGFTGSEAVRALLRAAGFACVSTRRDLGGNERISGGRQT